MSPEPTRSIERSPVLDRLGHVGGVDHLPGCKIRNRPRHLQTTMIGTRRQAQARHRLREQGAGSIAQRAVALDVSSLEHPVRLPLARALRRVSVDRGVDPRGCALVAFGGGGPLHACALAEALGMRTVLVPPFAGVLSAVGLALAPERHERAMSVLAESTTLSAAALQVHCDALAELVRGRERRWVARMRYVGQGHELDVRVTPGEDGPALAARFVELHRARYGFDLSRPTEVVGLRHTASEPGASVHFSRDPVLAPWDAALHTDGGGPASNAVVNGEASIALSDATLWVAAGWRATALDAGGWLLEMSA